MLTAQVLPCGVVLVVDPLPGVRVEVGLRGSVAQRVVADPHCQVDVEDLRRDQTLRVHQPPRGQLWQREAKNMRIEGRPGVAGFLKTMMQKRRVTAQHHPCGLCYGICCGMRTDLAVVERLLLGARLDEQLVRQSSVLRAVAIAVSGNPACLPVSIKSCLETYMRGEEERGGQEGRGERGRFCFLSCVNIMIAIIFLPVSACRK